MRFALLCVLASLTACGGMALQEGNPRVKRKKKVIRTVNLAEEVTSPVIREHMGGFNNCEARGKGQFISGYALVQFLVAADQRVERVHVIESTLGSWEIERCLLQAARLLTFSLPENADRAEFRYPFRFNELGERMTDPKPESWGYGSITGQRGAFNQCRTRYGYDAPFHITAYIGATGRARSVGFHSRTPAPDNFASCAVNAVGDARFPPSGARMVKYRSLVEYIGGK